MGRCLPCTPSTFILLWTPKAETALSSPPRAGSDSALPLWELDVELVLLGNGSYNCHSRNRNVMGSDQAWRLMGQFGGKKSPYPSEEPGSAV